MSSAGHAYAGLAADDAHCDLAWAAHVHTLADCELGILLDHGELAKIAPKSRCSSASSRILDHSQASSRVTCVVAILGLRPDQQHGDQPILMHHLGKIVEVIVKISQPLSSLVTSTK